MSDITIRSIQHYLYCPHRWGLLEINRSWAENFYVTRGDLIHNRVHENNNYTLRGKKVFTSVNVYNDDYNIYGVVDCIEGKKSKNGVNVIDDDNKYELCIVEYKPTKPKNSEYTEDDLMQVFAQKICVDYIFKCNCDAVLYYADVKKRVKLPLKENFLKYDMRLKEILNDIEHNIKYGIIPPIKKGQKCSGCSMKDMCMPSTKYKKSIKKQILENLEE